MRKWVKKYDTEKTLPNYAHLLNLKQFMTNIQPAKSILLKKSNKSLIRKGNGSKRVGKNPTDRGQS